MRDKFQIQLKNLDDEITALGELCKDEIKAAMSVLLRDKDEKIKRVRQYKYEIEDKSRDIEMQCRKLLIRQQPVASDLNTIAYALKLIRDMDRIGAQALELAAIALDVDSNSMQCGEIVREMSRALTGMVSNAVKAYVNKSSALAQEVIRSDDILDRNYIQIKDNLKDSIFSDTEEMSNAIDILMMAKYLERIGDHAVNIAEWVKEIS